VNSAYSKHGSALANNLAQRLRSIRANMTQDKDILLDTTPQPHILSIEYQTAAVFQESHSGPLPPAKQLTQYEAVIPGAAERILLMAEGNLQHTKDIEMTALKGAIMKDRIGQIFGLVVTLCALGVTVYSAYIDKPWLAAAIGSGTIVGLAAVFVIGKKNP